MRQWNLPPGCPHDSPLAAYRPGAPQSNARPWLRQLRGPPSPTQSNATHQPPLGQPTDSFAPNPCRYATIGALLGEKAAVPFAPFAPYHASAARTAPAVSLPPAPQRSTKAIFRPALLHAAAAEHRESLRTEGYAVVGKVYEPGGKVLAEKALKNAGCALSSTNEIYSIFWHRASARA